MKRFLRSGLTAVSLVLVACVASITMAPTPAHAAWDLVTVPLKWKEVGAIVYTDTTFLTDEADTIRTSVVKTSDWDFSAALGNVATGNIIATVTFISTSSAAAVASDTIYYTLERGVPATNSAVADSCFQYNGTIAAADGACALSGGLGTGNKVWIGHITAIPNANGVNNAWMVPEFRLRVSGDQSGSSPVAAGLRVYISYPKRR